MDLFTLWLVGHYVDERPVQPPCVVKITQSMRGEAGEPLADRVKRLIQATRGAFRINPTQFPNKPHPKSKKDK